VPEPVRVKVCGLTDAAQARGCADLGAWAIGVVFAPESTRRVTVERAADIVRGLPARVRRVGVFVDASPDEVARAVVGAGLTDVQLHGAEVDVVATRRVAGVPVIQGFSVDGPEAVARARDSEADLVLLDASVAGRHGGTGRTFDWSLLEGGLGRPFLLAGGLDPDNVADAVRRARPAMVDVSSGVERAPGDKDLARVAAFLAAVGQAAGVPA
jgi:phosphoribosylanthranilate isomerase